LRVRGKALIADLLVRGMALFICDFRATSLDFNQCGNIDKNQLLERNDESCAQGCTQKL